MSTWGEQLRELNELQRAFEALPSRPWGTPSPCDQLRRRYLEALAAYTGRAAIVYATCYLEGKDVPNQSAVSIVPGDVQGFMEAVSNIKERELDLMVTSPGGSMEAAESIMGYLRSRFDHIRCIVPVAAMSAATMMALACDEIVMGDHSQLGPIDPQFFLSTPEGPRSAPGQAILDQFELAKEECKDAANIGAWLPLLRSLAPGLLAVCKAQRELAEDFARRALEEHMFNGRLDAAKKATEVAAWFADFRQFKSHGRRVGRADAEGQELNVVALEADDRLQDLVLSVHHAFRHTFGQTGTTKIIENHHGRAYIEMIQQVQFVGSSRPTTPGGKQPGANRPTPPQPPRAQRRQAAKDARKKR